MAPPFALNSYSAALVNGGLWQHLQGLPWRARAGVVEVQVPHVLQVARAEVGVLVEAPNAQPHHVPRAGVLARKAALVAHLNAEAARKDEAFAMLLDAQRASLDVLAGRMRA